MNGEWLRGFGRLWANHGLQARPGFAWRFLLRARPGLPEPPALGIVAQTETKHL